MFLPLLIIFSAAFVIGYLILLAKLCEIKFFKPKRKVLYAEFGDQLQIMVKGPGVDRLLTLTEVTFDVAGLTTAVFTEVNYNKMIRQTRP